MKTWTPKSLKNAGICCQHFHDSDFGNEEKTKLKDRNPFPIHWTELIVKDIDDNNLELIGIPLAEDNMVINDTSQVTDNDVFTIFNKNDSVKTYLPAKKQRVSMNEEYDFTNCEEDMNLLDNEFINSPEDLNDETEKNKRSPKFFLKKNLRIINSTLIFCKIDF